jgi:spermidine synthase
VGLEIPLVMRILKQHYSFKDLVSQVLSVDYLGALVVSLAFPIILVPHLGLIRTSLMFGLFNVLVAIWTIWLFREQIGERLALRWQAGAAALVLVTGLVLADRATTLAEENLYADQIIYNQTTAYQHIVLTRWKNDLRLFLNNNLQFSSRDEYRYHEALIHPALQAVAHAQHVLVLGGGDGLAVREILKYPQINHVTLVDLDPRMTQLFMQNPQLTALNHHSLTSPKVTVINDDALRWLSTNAQSYDFIVVDFPDPTSFALGKLYSQTFYRLIAQHLSQHGLAVIQSTSPLYARKSFWSIVHTIQSVGLITTPYHALIPSFGEWGYIIASHVPYSLPTHFDVVDLRFVNAALMPVLFQFPLDMAEVPADVNRLNTQALVNYYEAEWKNQAP